MAQHRRGSWWKAPRLILDTHGEEERRVGWLELFFDLVFVVVIAELSHLLATHVTPVGLISYILLFVPVWWVWIGGTIYNARFESEDISFRLITFLQMLPVAAMAVFVHDGLGETSIPFALSYIAARVLITFVWYRAGRHSVDFRPVTDRFVIGFSISIVLWTTSLFVPPPWRFILWAIGVFLDVTTPLATRKFQARLPLSNGKLPERFGLFVIIVLGEQIVGVIRGVAERESVSVTVFATAALGMMFAFCIWWLYFDFIARRGPRRGAWANFSWSYLHMPLVMSIAALGAAGLNVIGEDHAIFESPVRWLFTGATAVVLLVMALLEITLQPHPNEPSNLKTDVTMRVIGAVVALTLGAFGGGLGQIPLLVMLLVPFILQMVYGTYVWFHQVGTDDADETRQEEQSVTA